MPTHLYCLLAPQSEARPSGVVRALEVQGVVAWVAATDQATLSRDARDVARATLEHDRVINAALAAGVTPVPASLADAYADDDAAMDDLRAHAAEIDRALRQVHGLVEMTVIIAVQDLPPAPDSVGRGRAYLEQLRTQPDRAGAIADRVAAELRPLFGDLRRRGNGGTVALSQLIARRDVESYRARALALARGDYRLVIDGPRAPYSFVRFSPGKGILPGGAGSAA